MQGIFSRGNSPVQQSTSIDSKSHICGVYGEDEGSLEDRGVVSLNSKEAQKDFTAGVDANMFDGVFEAIAGVFVAAVILAITIGVALIVAATTEVLLPVMVVLGVGSAIAAIAGLVIGCNRSRP